MMKATAQYNFEAIMSLTEGEVRVLEHLSGYESGLTKAIRENVTSNFNGDVFTALLKRWRLEISACLSKFDAARKAFEEKP